MDRKKLESRALAIIVNDPAFFVSHRMSLALRAQALGMRVHIITPWGPAVETIRSQGLTWHAWEIDRWSANPISELLAIARLWKILRSIHPDIVHAVTIKPVLYAGIAVRLGIPAGRVSAISGLGQVFTSRGALASGRRVLVKWLYRMALGGRRSKVIFQNREDAETFLSLGLLQDSQIVRIPGAGVDTVRFSPKALPDGKVRVLFASRLLAEKGIREFVSAAQMLRAQGHQLEFVVAGEPAPGNPSSISESEYQGWKSSGVVSCLGYQADMLPHFHSCHIAALPSYYGEGIPKFLIEAASCGLPIVATDWPGCRDIVQHQINGLLVPPRDPAALAKAIAELAANPALRSTLGLRGRERVLQEGFGQEPVLDRTLEIYGELL